MQKSAQDTQIACANTKCTQERQDKHIELYKYLIYSLNSQAGRVPSTAAVLPR